MSCSVIIFALFARPTGHSSRIINLIFFHLYSSKLSFHIEFFSGRECRSLQEKKSTVHPPRDQRHETPLHYYVTKPTSSHFNPSGSFQFMKRPSILLTLPLKLGPRRPSQLLHYRIPAAMRTPLIFKLASCLGSLNIDH
jgi:hypothetical protein